MARLRDEDFFEVRDPFEEVFFASMTETAEVCV